MKIFFKTGMLLAMTLLSTLLSQEAFADQLKCRGSKTTLVFTDMNGQSSDPNYVSAQVFDARYDGAKYADLFNSRVKSLVTVAQFQYKFFLAPQNQNTLRLETTSIMQDRKLHFTKINNYSLALEIKDLNQNNKIILEDKLVCNEFLKLAPMVKN